MYGMIYKVYNHQKNNDSAIQYYEKALQTNKKYHTSELYLNLSKCYIIKDEFKKAEELLDAMKDIKKE